MFPLTNKRQHQALVQSALQKIKLYQEKLLLEQKKPLTVEEKTNQSLSEFKAKSELHKRQQKRDLLLQTKSLQMQSVKEEPVKEEPVNEESVNEESVKEEPVKEEPVNEEPVKEEPVNEEPVKEEPEKEEPVNEESGNEEPISLTITDKTHEIEEEIKKQTYIASNLETQTDELKKQLMDEFASNMQDEE